LTISFFVFVGRVYACTRVELLNIHEIGREVPLARKRVHSTSLSQVRILQRRISAGASTCCLALILPQAQKKAGNGFS
jgi:hypothetical protein